MSRSQADGAPHIGTLWPFVAPRLKQVLGRGHFEIDVDLYGNVKHSAAMRSSTEGKYPIREMCDAFGITPRALRFYEDERLISPERRGTARLYSDRDRARVTWILRGKRVGFSLAEIKEMLDLYDIGDSQQTQLRVTAERCMHRIDALRRQKDDIDATIAELETFVGSLALPDLQRNN